MTGEDELEPRRAQEASVCSWCPTRSPRQAGDADSRRDDKDACVGLDTAVFSVSLRPARETRGGGAGGSAGLACARLMLKLRLALTLGDALWRWPPVCGLCCVDATRRRFLLDTAPPCSRRAGPSSRVLNWPGRCCGRRPARAPPPNDTTPSSSSAVNSSGGTMIPRCIKSTHTCLQNARLPYTLHRHLRARRSAGVSRAAWRCSYCWSVTCCMEVLLLARGVMCRWAR